MQGVLIISPTNAMPIAGRINLDACVNHRHDRITNVKADPNIGDIIERVISLLACHSQSMSWNI
jgi:hypothetical protein